LRRLTVLAATATVLASLPTAATASGRLTVLKSPSGTSGTVIGTSTSEDGAITAIDCGQICTAQLNDWSAVCTSGRTCRITPKVYLEATAAPEWQFVEWHGCFSTFLTPTRCLPFAMTGDRTVTAVFRWVGSS
jgi:hypothetical protein